MAYEVELGGASVRVEVRDLDGGRFEVVIDGHSQVVDAAFPEPGVMHLVRDGEAFEVDLHRVSDGYEVTLYGSRYPVSVIDERRKALQALTGGGGGKAGEQVITTSMPGKVVQLLVAEGDLVEEGQGIVVVEAMKMQNELKADEAGVVESIEVAEGDAVEGGAVLVRLGPVDEE